MKMRLILGAQIILICLFQIQINAQIPSWPIVTGSYKNSTAVADKKPAQVINWTSGSTISSIPTALSNRAAPAAPGYDNCGNMEFYVLHNGLTSDKNLFIYKPDGTAIFPTTPGTGLNASFADAEIQVLPVPGTINSKWYIIYNLNINNAAYTPSKVAYSILTLTGGTWSIAPTERDVPLVSTDITYNKGKAISKQISNEHFLYLCRRTETGANVNKIIIDKFKISSSGISLVLTSSPIDEDWWALTTVGSTMELNNEGSVLAMLSRNQVAMNLYFFKTTDLSFSRIPLEGLVIESGKTVTTLKTDGTYPWFKNFAKKMTGIEFSPNGRYLYIAGGGYYDTDYANLSYLGQIDLVTSTNVADLILPIPPLNAKIQTQYIDGWNNSNYAVSYQNLQDSAYWSRKQISYLQSSYDGNIYFTKSNSDTLFVIPDPNSPIVNKIYPANVDLSTSSEKNIKFNGYVLVIPDQIDGYDYLTNSIVSISPNPTTVNYGSGSITLTGYPTGGTWSSSPTNAISPLSGTTTVFTPSNYGENVISYTVMTPTGPCVKSISIDVIKSLDTLGTICIHKYLDRNCDGILSKKETVDPLWGWNFQIYDINNNLVTTFTTQYLSKPCIRLKPGVYTIKEVLQTGFEPSNPASGDTTVTLLSGQTISLNFLNCAVLPCEEIDEACLVDSLIINTGYNSLTNSVYPISSFDGLWQLVQSPTDPSITGANPTAPYIINKYSSWHAAMSNSQNSQWISANPTPDWDTDNKEEDGKPPYSFQRCFCFCNDVDSAYLDLKVLEDNDCKVYFDGVLIYTSPHNVTSNFLTPQSIQYATHINYAETHCLRVDLRNVSKVAMGLNLIGTVKTFYNGTSEPLALKDSCCLPTGNICGRKMLDSKCNQINDNNPADFDIDPGLQNWQIELWNSTTGYVTTAYTDLHGYYCFMGLTPGNYTVKEIMQPGFYPSNPSSGVINVPVIAGQTITADFLNCKQKDSLGTICVQKYLDKNCDGLLDSNDTQLDGWIIQIEKDGVIRECVTNDSYCCFILPPGVYTISEILQSGYTPSSPEYGQTTVYLYPDQTIYVDFLNCKNDDGSSLDSCCDEFEKVPLIDPAYSFYGHTYTIKNKKILYSPIVSVAINLSPSPSGVGISGGNLWVDGGIETYGPNYGFIDLTAPTFSPCLTSMSFNYGIGWWNTGTFYVEIIVTHEDGFTCKFYDTLHPTAGSKVANVVQFNAFKDSVKVLSLKLKGNKELIKPVKFISFDMSGKFGSIIAVTGASLLNKSDNSQSMKFSNSKMNSQQCLFTLETPLRLASDEISSAFNIVYTKLAGSKDRPDIIVRLYDENSDPILYDSTETIIPSDVGYIIKGFNGNEFDILKSSPNPAKNSVTLHYILGSEANIRLTLFDALGNEYNSINEGFKAQGIYTTEMDVSDLSNGVYYIKLSSATQSKTLKIIISR